MWSGLRRLIVLLIVAAAGFAGWKWLHRERPVLVQVATVEVGEVESTVSNTRAGSILACRRAKLSPAASGTIARLPHREGDRVASGAVLLELWNEDLKAQQTLAERQLEAARDTRTASCALGEQARAEFSRLLRLRPSGAVAVEVLEQARSEAISREAVCHADEARIRVAEAQIRVLAAELERTVLRAPFEGVIVELNGELHEVSTPSPPGIPTPPAVDLVEYGCLYASAPIDEVDAARVKPGQAARLTLDAFRGEPFAARVRRVGSYIEDREKQARYVTVEFSLDEPPERQALLLPGYSADVEVLLARVDDTLRIPTTALIPEQDRPTVLVLNAEGRIERRELSLGLTNWRFSEVRSGLVAGERVVLNHDDQAVTPGALAATDAATP